MWNEACEDASRNQAQSVVTDCLHKTRGNISDVFCMPVSWHDVACIAVCTSMAEFGDVVELICNKQLAKMVIANVAKIAPPPQDLSILLTYAAAKTHPKAGEIVKEPLFVEREKRVRHALQFTITEEAGSAMWERSMVKISCVLSFHMDASPVETLNAVFGSVVRSDLRRCEDLHESETKDHLDTVLAGDMVETVSDVLAAT